MCEMRRSLACTLGSGRVSRELAPIHKMIFHHLKKGTVYVPMCGTNARKMSYHWKNVTCDKCKDLMSNFEIRRRKRKGTL